VNQRRLAWTIWGVSVGLMPFAALLNAFGKNLAVGEAVVVTVGVVLWATVGALITSRQMGNRVGLIFAGVALSAAVGLAGEGYASFALERGLPLVAISSWVARVAFLGMIGPLAFLFLIFPTGAPPSRRWGWLLRVMLVAYAIAALLFALTPGRMNSGFADQHSVIQNPLGLPTSWKAVIEPSTAIAGFVLFFGGVLSAVSLIQRYRRSPSAERQQIRWLALLGVFTAAFMLLSIALGEAGVTGEVIENLSFLVLVALVFLGVPITCGVAILKHGLWDLDVVVRKTVQYGLLVAGFTAVVGLVVLLGPLMVVGVGSGTGFMPTVVVGVVLAIGFTLVRSRAQRWANRIVYGKRSTPYEVLSEFAERVGETYSTEDVLPRMAQLLGEASGSRTATVWLRIGDEMRVEASWPPGVTIPPSVPVRADELPAFGDDVAFEVKHQGELLGALTVLPAADDPMNPTKEKLIRDMAAQAGLVLRNVRLIEDLRESRRRIVSAQDERARALERNIHDGAQQQLVALSVQLRLAESMVERDPAKARGLLADLQARTVETLGDLRDLARGIYPPLLADEGLPAALEAQARKSSLPVTVQPDGVGRYGPDVESAVYFCCLEALNNVAKYAEASTVEIRLAHANGELRFDVVDDGHGFDPSTTIHGTGLQGMSDRLDAIGGSIEVHSAPGEGTRVVGRLPIDGGAG
jgi:signal transduction histidine kinase